jgi:hypothetical protein
MIVTARSALSEVQASARRLRDLLRELVLTAVEDQPRRCQVHLVTVVHDAALDVAAEAEQAAAALGFEQAEVDAWPVTGPQAVIRCQHHVTLLGETLVRQLAAPELLKDLMALGPEHGREVDAWAAEIMRCVQACQVALWADVAPALLAYWQELAEITDRSRARRRTPTGEKDISNA